MSQTFVHVEIPSANLEKTGRFYTEIFGWRMNYVEEADYMLFETGGGVDGAFYHSSQHTGKQGVVVYIQVENLDETLAHINQHGGKTVMPRKEVENLGSFALFSDPDENVLGIWQNA